MTTEEAPAYSVPPEPVGGPSSPRGPVRRRRLVAGAVVAVLALGGIAALLVATGRLGLPATPGVRVALIDPDGALAIVDADGGNRVVHATEGTTFSFPAWSPDGTHVAAVTNNQAGAAIEVFAAGAGGASAADGKVLYQSDSSAPFYLYWTPDSSAVTFLTEEGSSLALRSARADGSDGAPTLREGAPMYWAWDGPTRMLVHSGIDADAFIGTVGPDGSTIATVDSPPGLFRAPAASADGRYEAYVVARPPNGNTIVVAAADGTSRYEVPVFGPAAVSFAPSGSEAAFIGAAEGAQSGPIPVGQLRVVDAATGVVRPLPASDVLSFFWSPDGRTIASIGVPHQADPGAASTSDGAATTASGGARLASVRDGGGTTKPDADAPGVDAALVFVDVAAGTATPAQVVSLTPTFVNEVMPYFDQYALSHRVWAPDGSAILLPLAAADGTEALQVLPADGSPGRVLAPGSMGFWSP